MARRLGSKDKKKRLKKNAYGLTLDDIRKRREVTNTVGGLAFAGGAGLGYGAGTLLNRKNAKNLANARDLLSRTTPANRSYHSLKAAIKKMEASRLLTVGGATATGASLTAMGALGYLANKRGKETQKFRKSKEYKQRFGKT